MAFKDKTKAVFQKMGQGIIDHPFVLAFSLLAFIASLVAFILSYRELSDRLHFELSEIASCDANLFFTVGRFMANGGRPYLDAYENKPPMIFLVSELSYLMSGGFYLVNVSSFLCCLNLLLAPLALCIVVGIKRKMSFISTFLMSTVVFIISIFLLFYAEHRSGEIMCELFGASALMDALLCLAFISNDKKIHFYHPAIILCGFFIGVSAMFKEPFALLGGMALLLFVEEKKDLLNKVVYPIGYAVITIFFILLVTNSIEGYFTIYLPNMLNNHITTYGSLSDRMKDFKKLFDDLNNFSKYLLVLIVMMLFVSSLRSITMFNQENVYLALIFRIIRIIVPLIYLYIASLCVGLGGQYFWHHFAFALPLYYSSLLDSGLFIGEQINSINIPTGEKSINEAFKEIGKPFVSLSLVLMTTLTIISCIGLDKHEVDMKEKTMVDYVIKAKSDAQYIDSVLDALNEDNYLFMGFNGTDRPYCYTKHLPYGPCFVQDADNFKDRNNFFVKSFLEDFNVANVIVFSTYQIPVIEAEVKEQLANNFTISAPESVQSIERPKSFSYTIYYRI